MCAIILKSTGAPPVSFVWFCGKHYMTVSWLVHCRSYLEILLLFYLFLCIPTSFPSFLWNPSELPSVCFAFSLSPPSWSHFCLLLQDLFFVPFKSVCVCVCLRCSLILFVCFCSQKGLKNVFDEAILAALEPPEPKKKRKCVLLWEAPTFPKHTPPSLTHTHTHTEIHTSLNTYIPASPKPPSLALLRLLDSIVFLVED